MELTAPGRHSPRILEGMTPEGLYAPLPHINRARAKRSPPPRCKATLQEPHLSAEEAIEPGTPTAGTEVGIAGSRSTGGRDREIMGEYPNGRLAATLGWSTTAIMVVAGGIGIYTTVTGAGS